MPKASIVIPTLQKNKELLRNLVVSLSKEEAAGEIIVIDNSLKGLDFSVDKLRVITPDENLFVNPSWNLGVEKAKYEIVGLLNDDITISSDFLTQITAKMTPDMGLVGFHRDFILTSLNIEPPPLSTNITLEKINNRCGHFGTVMFFYKKNYFKIPDGLKIYCGDDWLVYQNKKHKKLIYAICSQKIYHFESLSCSNKSFNSIGDKDRKLYRKLTRTPLQFIFNIESVYKGFRITIFGIEILYHFNKKH